MTTPYDVPPARLIEVLTAKLRETPEVKAPDWSVFAKTGVHREKAPIQRDWWATRCAAVLRKVYLIGPVGTERLRGEFGGARDRGAKPDRARSGSGSILREALQQLEAAGLVENVRGKGRAVTPKGRSLVDGAAFEAKKKVIAEIPALAKY